MPFIIADRVRETSTTVGTGSIALAGAVTGYQSFDAVLDTADTTFYTIADQGGPNWEVGIGTFTSPSTLARTTILSSSNGGSIVNFTAGTKDVFIGLPASRTNLNDQPNVIDTNSSSAALRITQTGTGNALVVEDSANPDATPFVVDANGRMLSGATASYAGIFGNAGNVQISSTSLHGLQSGRFANDIFGSDIQLIKSRSATIGGQGAVQNGDSLGNVLFGGSDGTAFLAGAIINAAVDGTPGTNDMPGRLVFSTTADGASSPTERMRITNAGWVGINSSSPGAELEVADNAGDNDVRINLRANASTVSQIGASATQTFIDSVGARPFIVLANGSERMRIDASGNALINTTTAVSRLTVNGDVAGTFFVNPTTVSANYTIPTNYNAMTAGPITVNSGVTVTVGSGSTWTVL